MKSSSSNVIEHPVTVRLRQCRRLASVLEITRHMVNAAKQDNWEEVTKLEAIRREEFLACFEYEISDNDSRWLSEGIAALLSLNEELMDDLQAAKDKIVRNNVDLGIGLQSAEQYLDTGRLEP